jgi:outer membrane protein
MLLLLASAHALTLDDAWAAAESGSKELQLLHEQTVQAETLRGQAWSVLQPKLVAGANYTINQRPIELAFDFSSFLTPESQAQMEQFGITFAEPEPYVIQQKEFWDWNVSVIQPLFSGQSVPLLRGAYQMVNAARQNETAQRAQVRAGIAKAYWGVVVAREGEIVARQALENAQQHLKMAETTTAVGTAPPTVRLQAEIGVARAERQVAQAHEGVVVAEQAFARLTGVPADTVLEMPAPRPLPYDAVETALARASSMRADIAAADLQALAARNRALANTMTWLPTVDGRFTEAWSENVGFSGAHYNWMIVFSANWTLWDGGYRLAKGNEAASQARQAAIAADKLRDEATERVRGLWEQHARSERALAAVAKEISLAEENLRLAEASFAAGSLSYLEVEDARLGLEAARISALTERMTADTTAIDLLAATGDL